VKRTTDPNPLNAELNPICHLLALLGAHPIIHVSRIRVVLLRNRKVIFVLVKQRSDLISSPERNKWPYFLMIRISDPTLLWNRQASVCNVVARTRNYLATMYCSPYDGGGEHGQGASLSRANLLSRTDILCMVCWGCATFFLRERGA
jgi:hypothetical protein